MNDNEHNPIFSSCALDGDKLQRLLAETIVNPGARQEQPFSDSGHAVEEWRI